MSAVRVRPGGLLAAAALLAGLTFPLPAQAAVNFFDARVVSSGQFAADYGDDRHSGNTRGFGTDGQMTISWRWELRTVARGDQTPRGAELKSKASMFRRSTTATSSLVEYNHNGGPSGGELQEFPVCEKATFDFRTVDSDDRAPAKGAWTDGPHDPFGLVTNPDGFGFLVPDPPLQKSAANCLPHSDNPHVLRFYWVATADHMPLPRGSFNPRFDRKFSKTYSDSISLPLEHDGIPPTYHTAQGSSKLKVKLKRLSESKAEKRNDKYKTKPITGEADFAP